MKCIKNIAALLLLICMISALNAPAYAVNYKARHSEAADVLYFDDQPVFDGVINEYEWGVPTVRIIDDGSSPSSFSMRVGDTGKLGDASATPDHYFDMWLRWDEKYFYLALKTPDNKPFHQYADGSGDFWNGDVIQFGTDSGGNWEMQDGPTQTSSWGTGYKLHLFAKCSNDNKDYAFSYNYTDYSELLYCIKNDGKFTSYETAIPWSPYIIDDIAEIKAGKVLGFAMTLLFANDASDYYGWMGWGDNICYNQLDESRVGNNAITLSSSPAVVLEEVTESVEITDAVKTAETAAPPQAVAVPQTSDYSFIIYAVMGAASLLFAGTKLKRKNRV